MFGSVRIMVFFVIEARTRAVHIAGMQVNPDVPGCFRLLAIYSIQ